MSQPTRTERLITVETPQGPFRVWTDQVGEASDERPTVLLLHGGPGATHTYLMTLGEHLPGAGIPFVHYDQLGSGASDRPDGPDSGDLWDLDRFVSELEQVIAALIDDGAVGAGGLVLYGQSWGGILLMEYAVRHAAAGDLGSADRVRGLVISNMMSSIPAYVAYARDVIMPTIDPDVLARIQQLEAEGQTETEEYDQLLMDHHNVYHLLRRPFEEWPQHVIDGFGEINRDIYVPMQGPSELGASGKLERWDRSGDLSTVDVPTLVIGAAHDTMDPEHKRWMAEQFPQGRFHLCPDGSHLAMDDDEDVYFEGLLDFLTTLPPRP